MLGRLFCTEPLSIAAARRTLVRADLVDARAAPEVSACASVICTGGQNGANAPRSVGVAHAAEADVVGGIAGTVALAGGRSVAVAVLGGTQVGAPLGHEPGLL